MTGALSVALVSRSNSAGGGASRIAEELADWLGEAGAHVTHYCAYPAGPLTSFQAPLYPSGITGKVLRATHGFTRRIGLNEIVPSEFYTTLRPVLDQFDVVHFHDLNTAIAPLTLRLCALGKAVVFTAHDCSCLTGGCIYPMGCGGFLKSCGRCPQLASMGARFDWTSTNLSINRQLARQTGMHYVFPSRWLHETALKSLEFANSARVIPNGFSPARYSFRSKADARLELGIRSEQRVILVAAHYLADPRKGVAHALAAVLAVADLAPLVIFVGIPPADLEVRLPGVRYWLTGFVGDRKKLGLFFAASDVFLFSSLEDNLPIMVQESLAAGTPVVGFAAGGVPEMVDHERNGWLCAPGDQTALNQNLRNAFVGGELAAFSDAGRKTIQERFDFNEFGKRHLDLYEEVVR